MVANCAPGAKSAVHDCLIFNLKYAPNLSKVNSCDPTNNTPSRQFKDNTPISVLPRKAMLMRHVLWPCPFVRPSVCYKSDIVIQ